MFAVFWTSTGVLFSVGSVLADVVPDGLTVAVLSDRDAAALLAGRGRWDESSRTVQPRDYSGDTVDLAALGAVVAADPTLLAACQARILTARGRANGAEWVAPEGRHDAYPAGARVTYGGKVWESLIPANVWPPGVSGWREITREA